MQLLQKAHRHFGLGICLLGSLQAIFQRCSFEPWWVTLKGGTVLSVTSWFFLGPHQASSYTSCQLPCGPHLLWHSTPLVASPSTFLWLSFMLLLLTWSCMVVTACLESDLSHQTGYSPGIEIHSHLCVLTIQHRAWHWKGAQYGIAEWINEVTEGMIEWPTFKVSYL